MAPPGWVVACTPSVASSRPVTCRRHSVQPVNRLLRSIELARSKLESSGESASSVRGRKRPRNALRLPVHASPARPAFHFPSSPSHSASANRSRCVASKSRMRDARSSPPVVGDGLSAKTPERRKPPFSVRNDRVPSCIRSSRFQVLAVKSRSKSENCTVPFPSHRPGRCPFSLRWAVNSTRLERSLGSKPRTPSKNRSRRSERGRSASTCSSRAEAK